tara:strand:- start:4941 stop:5843 length:903 start_codon:yes stop_codon:yes gene_type:complete
MEKEDKTFTATLEGKETQFEIQNPTQKDYLEGQKVYNTVFNGAIQSGAPLRRRVGEILKEQGLWDDSKQKEMEAIQKEIIDKEYVLHKGGIKASEGKTIALEIKKFRDELSQLLTVHTEFDGNTCEGQADNARFNFLVSACVIYSSNKEKYFKTYEDFLAASDSSVGFAGSRKLANMLYGLDDNFENNLTENVFLKEYKFVDEEFRPINKEGHLVDSEDRLIDEDGFYVDEEENRVNIYGYKLNDEGEFAESSSPFLDDEGNPIVQEKPEPEAEEEAEVKEEEEESSLEPETKEQEQPAI